MSADFIARLVGFFVFSILGGYLGADLAQATGTSVVYYTTLMTLVGALFGLVMTPFISTRPVRGIRRMIGQITAETLFAGLMGLIVGLLVAALLTFPLSLLPPPFGNLMPFVGVLLFGYLGIAIFVMRQSDIISMLRSFRSDEGPGSKKAWGTGNRTILLDTSVIIDGRIADIARTGFLPGTLLIPRFVLNELQYIADSADNLRRQRGRRGMEVLAELQKTPNVTVRISDIDVDGVREVDDKLVILARQMQCPILTNDYNLNRIAELQGVPILNINELANAVKSVVLPGETITLDIIQEGREPGQGVGYMDDGTMVVVEDGANHIGQRHELVVTKVLQTAAGRMIFARLTPSARPTE